MDDWFWGRYSIPVGISLILQNGHYTQKPVPTDDELTAAGTDGIDFFRGGYDYHVSGAVEAALIADGYL